MCLTASSKFEDLEVTNCAQKAFDSAKAKTQKQTEYNWKDVTDCFEKSFSDPSDKQNSTVTIFTTQQKAEGLLSNFDVTPALVIEDYIVRGNLDSMSLASSICDSLVKPPSGICNNLPEIIDTVNRISSDPYTKDMKIDGPVIAEEDKISFNQIVIGSIILIGSLCLIIACAMLAKRLLDKNLYRHINSEVNQNVHAYIRMRQEETTKQNTSGPSIEV